MFKLVERAGESEHFVLRAENGDVAFVWTDVIKLEVVCEFHHRKATEK